MTRPQTRSFVFTACAAIAIGACTSSEPPRHGATGGSTGSGGTAGTSDTGGSTGNPPPSSNGGDGGSPATGGTTGTGGSSATGGTGGTPATGGTGGTTATGGSTGGGGSIGAGKPPACISNDVAGAVNRINTNFSECDVQDQGIDFDVAANYDASNYATNVKKLTPGYDPSTTPVTITNYGTAFSGYAVQMCHPYCYKANLTVGVDFVPGSDAGMRGEAQFAFPATGTGLPITNAVGRASLGWLYLDGPALPAGAVVTAQMELVSKDKGLLLANASQTKPITVGKWLEFRPFPIESAFNTGDLTNITSMGFRLTMSGTGAAEWHGVVYADHFQLRK